MLSRTFASLFLFFSGVSISDCAMSAGGGNNRIESDVSDIVLSGPQALLPRFRGDYTLSWNGGRAPFTVILAEEPCPKGFDSCAPGVTIFNQRSGFQGRHMDYALTFRDPPHIARLVGTVIDADGVAFASAPLNVRVGTDSRYFIDSYNFVDLNAENGCSASRSFSPATFDEFDPDEAFIRITDETAEGMPVFSWDAISQPSVAPNDSVTRLFQVWERGTGLNQLYGLEDEEGGEVGFLPPLAYGDYTRPGTRPSDQSALLPPLPMPAPPLPVARWLQTSMLTSGGGCGEAVWRLNFALNPPAPGDPVIGRGPVDEDDFDYSDPKFLKFLEFISTPRRIQLPPEQAAIAACVNDGLGVVIIAEIQLFFRFDFFRRLVDDADDDDPDIDLDALVFDIVTNPSIREALRDQCATAAASQTGNPERAQTATTPDFDLELVSGTGRVTLPDATTVSEIRTAHAKVIVSGGAVTIDIGQTADAQRSAIGSPDSPLVVTPNNPALPETTVPPGFFVILSDTSISDPTEFAMFADGFE